MEMLNNVVGWLNGIVWGPPMLFLILGVGLFLTIGLRFLTIKRIPLGFGLLWKGQIPGDDEGQISPFNALMTSLSATIGTGNIAGVVTAVALGGPGAIFWMWMTALVGMATKYAEAVCAVRFRETDEDGDFVGGPMYYIRNGLGENWNWLAICFAIFAMIAGFGIGNMVLSQEVSAAMEEAFGVDRFVTGIALAVLAAAVLLGGIKRISTVAGKLVPAMAVLYILAALVVLVVNIDMIPQAFGLIFTYAFTPHAVTGGAIWAAIRYGVARGVFSKEAGLGSAPIAHAAAQTKEPVSQGLVAMLGTFIDTIIVCTFTGLAILCTIGWDTAGQKGAALTAFAFETALPGSGAQIIAISIEVFASTTILGWSYHSERAAQYVFGRAVIMPFRLVWCVMVLVGAVIAGFEQIKAGAGFLWLLSDTLNAMMVLPSLIALAALSPVIFKITRDFFDSRGESENNPF
jgi:AGCS family alanine or glycine:cation symporter